MSDSPQEKARDALYAEIERQAADDELTDEQTQRLANAYSQITHGPQGGDYTRSDTDTMDYHYTQHQGEERPRPTGFGADR